MTAQNPRRSAIAISILVTGLMIACGKGESEPSSLSAASATQLTGVANGLANPAPRVRVTDGEGAGVTGADVTFTVTSGGGIVTPGTAQTDGDGFATAAWSFGANAGANSVRAAVPGSNLNNVTFNATTTAAQPADANYPNEPAGFVVIHEDQLQGPIWAGNGVWRDGWAVENLIDPTYNVTMGLAVDTSATASPPTALEFGFTLASRSGGGPRIARLFAAADHIYVSAHFQLSPTFSANWGPQSFKLLVIEPNNVIVSVNHWNPQNNGGGPRSSLVDVWSRLNNGGHDYLNTFQGNGIRTWNTVTNSAWHQFELRLQRGSAAGQGTVEWWLDGVLQGQHTGLTFGTASNGSPFNEIKLTPQQGGSGSLAPGSMNVRFDHVRISRQP